MFFLTCTYKYKAKNTGRDYEYSRMFDEQKKCEIKLNILPSQISIKDRYFSSDLFETTFMALF